MPKPINTSILLEHRISIGDVRLVDAQFDFPAHVARDILVDSNVVEHTLEWTDGGRNLVRQDSHLLVNQDFMKKVAHALGDDEDVEEIDIFGKVMALLRAAIDDLKPARRRRFFAAQSPRGFANEIDVHVFLSRGARDAWVAEHWDDGDMNSATRGAYYITAKRAQQILGDRGDAITASYNSAVFHT